MTEMRTGIVILGFLVGLLIGPDVVRTLRLVAVNIWTPKLSVPMADDAPDFVHSVKTKYADPEDDFRNGYIDKLTYISRMSGLKRFINYGALSRIVLPGVRQ